MSSSPDPAKAVAVTAATGKGAPFPQNLRDGAIYAVQIIICCLLLRRAYAFVNAGSVLWAMVSAATVLQPGLKDSFASSWRLLAANIIGAAVALFIGVWLGDRSWQFLVALVIVIAVCSCFHLDQSLRSACVAVFIVMLITQEHFVATGIERTISVAVGCGMAMAAEWITHVSRQWFNRRQRINAPVD